MQLPYFMEIFICNVGIVEPEKWENFLKEIELLWRFLPCGSKNWSSGYFIELEMTLDL